MLETDQIPGTQASIFVFVQSLSCVRLFVTPWTAARQAYKILNQMCLVHKRDSIKEIG